MRKIKIILNHFNTFKYSVLTLIFLQLLVNVKCANLLYNQKNEDDASIEYISNNEGKYDQNNYVNNNEMKLVSHNYVSKFTIDELLKLKFKKSVSNDIDMDLDKSGL